MPLQSALSNTKIQLASVNFKDLHCYNGLPACILIGESRNQQVHDAKVALWYYLWAGVLLLALSSTTIQLG